MQQPLKVQTPVHQQDLAYYKVEKLGINFTDKSLPCIIDYSWLWIIIYIKISANNSFSYGKSQVQAS